MGEPHHRSTQVWHALSRDHTVLPAGATNVFINEQYESYLPSPFQLKLLFIYRPQKEERLSWLTRLVTYLDGLLAHRWSPIQIHTGPDVD